MNLQEKRNLVRNLFEAVQTGNKDNIKKYFELLKKERINPQTVKNDKSQNILGAVCSSLLPPTQETFELIDFFIQDCGMSASDITAGSNYSTPIMCVIEADVQGSHKLLVDKLFSYESLSKPDRDIAFIYYAAIGDIEKVELCLTQYGCDVNFNPKNLGSALTRSVVNGKYAMVEKLLEIPNIEVGTENFYGETLLIEAIEKQEVDIARLLLEKKGEQLDIYAQSPFLGTPLTAAIFYQKYDLVCRLLEEEESFNDKDHPGAVLCAIRNDDAKTLKMLFEKGADVNVTGKEGYEEPDGNIWYENRTSPFFSVQGKYPLFDLPILVAIREGKLNALKTILEFKPDLTKKGELGDTVDAVLWSSPNSNEAKSLLNEYKEKDMNRRLSSNQGFWQLPIPSAQNYPHCPKGDNSNKIPQGKILPATITIISH